MRIKGIRVVRYPRTELNEVQNINSVVNMFAGKCERIFHVSSDRSWKTDKLKQLKNVCSDRDDLVFLRDSTCDDIWRLSRHKYVHESGVNEAEKGSPE